MPTKKCIACGKLPSVSVDERGIPPLCGPCWERAGTNIRPRSRVVCTVDADGCSGTVDRLEDDGFFAVVRTADGQDAWVPVAELVRVTR